jgi:signal transduction histidine kinase/DNA-binding NarL/FixJ family response regulator
MMKFFSIKYKLLLAFAAFLVIITALNAGLTAYLINRQSEAEAFTRLSRQLILFQNDLQTLRETQLAVALEAANDQKNLSDLAILYAHALKLAKEPDPALETTFRLNKATSLNRLQLILLSARLSSVAVYLGGELSHYITQDEAGMSIRRNGQEVVISTHQKEDGKVYLSDWRTWLENPPPMIAAPHMPLVDRVTVSFDFPTAQMVVLRVVVPIQGITRGSFRETIVERLTIATPETLRQPEAGGGLPQVIGLFVFSQAFDTAFLEEIAAQTGLTPSIFSTDGQPRLQLIDAGRAPAELLSTQDEWLMYWQTITIESTSYYQVLMPWQIEGKPGLILAFALSQEGTSTRIRQTVLGIVGAAALILLVGGALGYFLIARLVMPIKALTAAVSMMGFDRAAAAGQANIEEASHTALAHYLERPLLAQPADEIGELTYAFNKLAAQLYRSFETLEARVRSRTKRLESALQETQSLLQAARTILDSTQLEEICKNLLEHAARLVQADRMTLFLVDHKSREILFRLGCGNLNSALQISYEELSQGISGQVWQKREPVLSAHPEDGTEPFETKARRYQDQGGPLIVVPLVTKSEVIGTITAINRSDQPPFSRHEADLLAALARQATATIENARLLEQTLRAKENADEARRAAEKANLAKSVFLANMSHELRTPLNAILGYAQILQQRPLDADVIDALNTVQRSGEHLLTLITDILDIAKIEAGRMELFPTQLHFPTFLQDIASIIGARARAKNLSFSFEAIPPLPTGVQADETRLRQVLLNLLGNAVKFTDEGQVTLRVKAEGRGARRKDENSATPLHPSSLILLTFEVADTGPGILPDQLERIFQPFEQVGEVTRRREGTGLGLTLSRQLVELMGGELHVESPLSLPPGGGERERGPGSLFWFEVALPVMKVAVEPAQPPERVITGYTGPRCTVLVVDDIASNRAVLVNLLEPLGFEVFEAADGQQAIHLAREIRPNLILMDRWMPVLDGLEATRQIRQNPELAEVPILAVSASVSKEDQARSQEVGYDDFLPKPIHWPNLAAMLAEHLDLEWSYSEEKEEGIQPSALTLQPSELAPPPQEELAILLDLARRGNIRAIRERAAHIETLGEQYVAFARRLRRLAKDFEEQEILALVEQYMTALKKGQSQKK